MSVDSMFVHKMWVDHELSKMVDGGVPFPMLSDGGGKVGEVYGVYDPAGGVDVRGRFIIDPDGVVQAMEMLTPPVGRNVAETLRQLAGLPVGAREPGGQRHAQRLAAGQKGAHPERGPGGQGVAGVEGGGRL